MFVCVYARASKKLSTPQHFFHVFVCVIERERERGGGVYVCVCRPRIRVMVGGGSGGGDGGVRCGYLSCASEKEKE